MRKHIPLALAATLALQCAGMGARAADAPAATPATPHFVEETDTAGLQSRFEGQDEFMVGGGVAVFDCDGDGLPEVYITAGVNKAKFYRNKSTRGGAIKLQEERSGLELTNATGAYPLDIDGDGNMDLVVLRVGELEVFRGLGQCKFERANDKWNIPKSNDWHTAFSATWEKGNAMPTLAIGSYYDRSRPDFPWGTCTSGLLLRPDATGKRYAAPELLTPSYCALSMLFSDWNRSGEASLRIANDREYYQGGQEQLWKVSPGQPAKQYTTEDGWKRLQVWGMGIASHDIDGDGYPQVFITSMADNKFQKLQGEDMAPSPGSAKPPEGVQPSLGLPGGRLARPNYIDQAYKRGITAHRPYVGGDYHPSTAWHAQFADVNNDGFADLFIVKGNVSTMPDFAILDPNNLLLQETDGHFTEVGQQAGVASYRRGRGGMLADLNGDGLLDMVVVNRLDKAQLWRNVGAGTAAQPAAMGHWLQLRLNQAGGNRDAVGAWVEVDLGGRIIREELTVGGGHASGHLGWMHFGLGTAKDVKVRVQWPHGPWSDWAPLAGDGFYVVNRETGVSAWKAP
ncbi:MAG: CRTAC1 family protein [Leptothrix ochracea]|uniref:CRTAC1 family protein n=1 Tax=Leptothrix ochracea TaxID=735331 RepID=UPI0034E1A05F